MNRTIYLFAIAAITVLLCVKTAAANFNAANAADFQAYLTTAQDNGESDTITVAAGTYNLAATLTYTAPESENFDLTITGAGSATTILDGGGTIRVMSLTGEGGGSISVSGLRFENGRVSDHGFGAGLYVLNNGAGDITVDQCVATNGSSAFNTGGAWFGTADGDITVTNSSFTHNTCDEGTSDDGCGLYLYFDGASATGNAIVRGNDVSNNTLNHNPAPVGNCDGAGMMIYHLGTSGAAPTITIEDNTFNDNLSYEGAAGVSLHILHQEMTLILDGNTFSGNVAGPLPEGVEIQIFGGGIHAYLDGGDAVVTNNLFLDNRNLDPYGMGAGLCLDNLPTGSLRVSGNVFAGNQCSGLGGGAVINPGEGVTSAVIANNLFVNNQAGLAEGSGGGLSISAGTDTNLTNNTFYNNTASNGGGLGYYTEAAGNVLSIANDLYWGNTPNSIGAFGPDGSIAATYSNIDGGSGESYFGAGCVDSDPLFSAVGDPAGPDGVYATEDDGLHLTAGSPSANTGSSAALPAWLTEDIAGAARTQGGAVDMGCYEGQAGAGTALSVSLSPSTISEDGGTSTATVTRPGDTTDALTVNIASSDETVATVPATVTILAGSSTATFTVTAVDNPGATGTRTATITVSAETLEDGSAIISVTDDEALSLTISPGSISEAETATGTVSIPAVRETDLAVALSSSNTDAATVPDETIIAAGALSAAFTVTAVDDASAAGDRLVTITATAEGFANGSASVTVTDDDEAGFTVAVGSVYQVSVGDLGEDAGGESFAGDNFLRKPKITAEYYDPIKDPEETKLKNAKAKVSFDRSAAGVTSVDCEWKKKICLYDKKAILKSQTAEEYIPEVQVENLEMDQWVSVADDNGNSGPFACGTVTLMPPSITGVFSDAEFTVPIVSAAAGATIYVEGRYFGSKPPKVWLEYQVEKSSGTQIKAKKCKVLKPLAYIDAKGKTGKSCMDLTAADGQSRIRVQLPPKFPRGWTAGPHNIVIDNKVGRATVDFATE